MWAVLASAAFVLLAVVTAPTWLPRVVAHINDTSAACEPLLADKERGTFSERREPEPAMRSMRAVRAPSPLPVPTVVVHAKADHRVAAPQLHSFI